MIPGLWYAVMDSGQIGDRPVGVVRMGEQLFQADHSIVAYRRRRQELIDKSR